MYKPRRPNFADDYGDCNESACSFYNDERTQDTLSLTSVYLSSRSPEQQGQDQRLRRYPDQQDKNHKSGVQRTPSRRDSRLRATGSSSSRIFSPRSVAGNTCISALSSDSSVCSRSAPKRRTRIARAPSMYSVNSGSMCNISRRSFNFDSRGGSESRNNMLSFDRQRGCGSGGGGGERRNAQWQSQVRQTPSLGSLPIIHIDLETSPVNTGGNTRPGGSCDSQLDLVDIAPGVKVPLRGVKETVKAVAKDYYANVSCFGCSLELCCIADVSYVVCPVCKVVSPMENPTFEGKEVQRHGLGLGFTYEDLFKMQLEIIEDRKRGRR